MRCFLLLVCGFVLKTNPLQSQNKFTLLEVGKPPGDAWQKAKEIIGNQWGITFNSVAGCTPESSLLDSVLRENEKTRKLLSEIHGEKWEEMFDKEVQYEFERQSIVKKMVEEMEELAKLKVKHEGVYQKISWQDGDIYNSEVIGLGSSDNKQRWLRFYLLEVNLKTQEIKILSAKKSLFVSDDN